MAATATSSVTTGAAAPDGPGTQPAPTAAPSPGPDDSGTFLGIFQSTLLPILGLLLLLPLLALGALALLRRRRQPAPQAGTSVTTTGPAKPVNGKAMPHTTRLQPGGTLQPNPGIPYLESVNRLNGPVYYPLHGEAITIGRERQNGVMIDEHFPGWQSVSRTHATIELDGSELIIVDMDSDNGIYVNGKRTGENLLREGYRVGIGQVQFIYRENRGA